MDRGPRNTTQPSPSPHLHHTLGNWISKQNYLPFLRFTASHKKENTNTRYYEEQKPKVKLSKLFPRKILSKFIRTLHRRKGKENQNHEKRTPNRCKFLHCS